MADFKIRETAALEPDHGRTRIEITIADTEEVDDAGEYVNISVTIAGKTNPLLATLQLEALHRAQTIIEEQAQALARLPHKTH
jgi:hypothetical protein